METKLSRRGFLRQAATGAVALAAGAGLRAAPAARKPNIIFILADDLGYGDVGCFGQKRIRTPRLDRMAREGMRFTSFYAGSTVCAPSRSCLMTGQHTGHTHIRGNAQVPLRPQDVTVAEVLRQGGYRTALVGKWGLGEVGTTGYPTRKGFDQFYGLVNQVDCHFHYFEHVYRNEEKLVLDGNDHKKQTGAYLHDLFTAEALAFVGQSAHAAPARPFFLYLAYIVPHAELVAPADAMQEYQGAFPETPFPGNHYGAQATPRAAYAAMVSRMDRDVGRLLDKLHELQLAENTLVIFSSDNGPHLEGGADPAFFGSSGPFSGAKRSLTDGGIRVPMIAWQPGTVPAGTTCDHPFAFWDFLPTAAEWAGVPLPDIRPMDGVSFAPALRGEMAAPPERNLYWEFHEGKASQQAVRRGRWKAVANPCNGPLALFDVVAEPAERTDLAHRHPDVVEEIRTYLKTARTESAHWRLKPGAGKVQLPVPHAAAP